jgi:hypothetical protein
MQNRNIAQELSAAVNLVNSHSGSACIHLLFNGDGEPIDFIANRAELRGDAFSFTSGFDTLGGSLRELAGIKAELIGS